MRLRTHIRNQMISGVVTLVPIAVTVVFVWWVVDKMRPISAFLERMGVLPPVKGLGPLVSVLAACVLIYLAGLLVNNYVGRRLVRLGETIIQHIPIVKTIYSTVKQIADSMSVSGKGFFKEVVLFEYPREGIWTIGFVTGKPRENIEEKTSRSLYTIFVPTTPNPTSGMLVLVPADKVIKTGMAVEEGMRAVVSGGLSFSVDEEAARGEEGK